MRKIVLVLVLSFAMFTVFASEPSVTTQPVFELGAGYKSGSNYKAVVTNFGFCFGDEWSVKAEVPFFVFGSDSENCIYSLELAKTFQLNKMLAVVGSAGVDVITNMELVECVKSVGFGSSLGGALKTTITETLYLELAYNCLFFWMESDFGVKHLADLMVGIRQF